MPRATIPSEPRLSRPQRVAEAIKGWVMDEGWQPGHRLPSEAALMTRFAMAKGTIREAIRILEAQGLVTSRTGPGGGVFVHRVTEGRAAALLGNYFYFTQPSIDDIYQIRAALEPELAAHLAGRLSEDELARLEAAIDDSVPPADTRSDNRSGSPADVAATGPDDAPTNPPTGRPINPPTNRPTDGTTAAPSNRPNANPANASSDTPADEAARHAASLRFHAVLAGMSDNPLLAFVIRFTAELLGEVTVTRGLHTPTDPALWEAGLSHQRRLVAALRAGDADTARAVMQAHMAIAHRLMRVREATPSRRFLREHGRE